MIHGLIDGLLTWAGDFLLQVLFCASWCVFAFFNGCEPCCGDGSSSSSLGTCGGCTGGNLPDSYQVDLSGIIDHVANPDCGAACLTLNGTYILPFVSWSPVTGADYSLSISSVCGYDRITLNVDCNAADLAITVTMINTADQPANFGWRKTYGGATQNCAAWSSESVGRGGTNANQYCTTGVGSVALVTAL